ncbi:MAG: hypothetical protein Q8R08_00250 [bacterium]|nr:hypothetical protein [bacterium]
MSEQASIDFAKISRLAAEKFQAAKKARAGAKPQAEPGPDFGEADPSLFAEATPEPTPSPTPPIEGGEEPGTGEKEEWTEEKLRAAFDMARSRLEEKSRALTPLNTHQYLMVDVFKGLPIITEEGQLKKIFFDLWDELKKREKELNDQYCVTPGAYFDFKESGAGFHGVVAIRSIVDPDTRFVDIIYNNEEANLYGAEVRLELTVDQIRKLYNGNIKVSDVLRDSKMGREGGDKGEKKLEWTEEKIKKAYEDRFALLKKFEEALRRGDTDEAIRIDEEEMAKIVLPRPEELSGEELEVEEELWSRYRDEKDRLIEEHEQLIHPDPEKSLEKARARLLKAEKEMEKLSGVKKVLGSKLRASESYSTLKKALDDAEAEYQLARAEVVGADVERHCTEQETLVEQRLAVFGEVAAEKKKGKAFGWAHRAYEFHKGLAKYNLEGKNIGGHKIGAWGKYLNVRTGISAGLLLGGGAVGMWAGMGIIQGVAATSLARRAAGGFGMFAGYGTFDLLNSLRKGRDRKQIEKLIEERSRKFDGRVLTVNEMNEAMAAIESQAMIDGNSMIDLRADKLYMDLKGQREVIWRKSADELTATGRVNEFLEDNTRDTESTLKSKFIRAGHARRLSKVAGITVGALIASPALAQAAENINLGSASKLVQKGQEAWENVSASKVAQKAKEIWGQASEKVSDMHEVAGRELMGAQAATMKEIEDYISAAKPQPVASELPSKLDLPDPDKALQEEAEKILAGKTPSPLSSPLKGEEVGSAGKTPSPDVEATTEATSPPQGGKGVTPGRTELVHNGKATGAYIETKDGQIVVHAGKRGIEGALLDMKGTPQYEKMMNWLEENYSSETPGADNTPGALVHRYVLEFANENELTIGGGGPADLNQSIGAELEIDPESGEIEMDKGDIRFLGETTPSSSPPSHGGESAGTLSRVADIGEPPEIQGGGLPPGADQEALKTIQEEAEKVPAPKSPELAAAEQSVAEARQLRQETQEALAELRKSLDTPLPKIEPPEISFPPGQALSELKEALGNEKYSSYLEKALGVSNYNLNQVQSQSLANVMERFNQGSSAFKDIYKGLVEKITESIARNELTTASLADKKVGEFVVEHAKRYYKIN